MIRVTVELWPGGEPEMAEVIGHVLVANQTPGADPASYAAVVLDSRWEVIGTSDIHQHRRSEGWAALLRSALESSDGLLTPDALTKATAIKDHVIARLPGDDRAGGPPDNANEADRPRCR